LLYTSGTPEIPPRRVIDQHRNSSRMKNNTNPTNETLRKPKAPENLKHKSPTDGVECLSDINPLDLDVVYMYLSLNSDTAM